jgi:hypothetical protein
MTWYREAIHGLRVQHVVEFDSGSCSVFYLLGRNQKEREIKERGVARGLFSQGGSSLAGCAAWNFSSYLVQLNDDLRVIL